MRRHDLDVFSLVSGIVFLAAAAAFLVGAYTDLQVDARVAWSVGLVGVGIAGVAAAVTGGRREDAAYPAADQPPTED